MIRFLLAAILIQLTGIHSGFAQPKKPIMGWSSWNHFRIHINEKMIREQADALISSGLYEAGYRYINIDDGFFGGRDSLGNLFQDSLKFPSGMKSLATYIHSKGLKAGIYSDAGKNTCGSIYDKDPRGIGVGLYGHVERDSRLFFSNWGYDFLKIDWCGGKIMELNDEATYSAIIDTIKAIDSNLTINVCRWQFPGIWAIKKADSWRVSKDIRASYASILNIININANLHQYASPGHYNDMDMLQVGRGMTYDEDKTHFSMWCMLNSPLLAGNDLRNMSRETVEILSNKEIIALNQDKGFKQATRISKEKDIEIWQKPLGNGENKAIAIMNKGNKPFKGTITAAQLHIEKQTKLRDLWQHAMLGAMGSGRAFTIPPHGIIVLKTY